MSETTRWPTPGTGDEVQLELWRRAVAAATARHDADLRGWRLAQWPVRVAEAVLEAVRSRSPRRLLRLPLAVVRIVRERGTFPPRPTPPELPPRPVLVTRPSAVADVTRARAAFDDQRWAAALEAAESALAIDPRDVRALDVARRALEEQGELTQALAFLRRQREVQDRTWLATSERRLQGLLIALDPRWCPPVARFDRDADGRVLLLAREGPVPARRRLVVTGTHDVPPAVAADTPPLDTAVQDAAWWAARRARASRPSGVAAVLATDLRDAVAAWALARAGAVPFLLVTGTVGAPTPGGEHGRLVRERESQLRAAAAAVVADVDDLPGVATGQVS